MRYPRVLIYNQPFNDFSGGGITLSNLFRGWPKQNVAVVATGHFLYNVSTDICDIYYQLGAQEQKWIFPFSLIQRAFSSGPVDVYNRAPLPLDHNQKGVRFFLVHHFVYPFLEWIGLFHCMSQTFISETFKRWILQYQPEVLYVQVSTRESILFATKLIDYTKLPAVIHMMDDWPSTISSHGLFKRYWYNKIDAELRQLLDKVDCHLSISDLMSDEYERRYRKKFVAFHNPIDTTKWLPYCKKELAIIGQCVHILHSGRIGAGITQSLLEAASAIDRMTEDGRDVKLHIQTAGSEHEALASLKEYKCVVVDPFVEYSMLPQVFSKADILLIAVEFEKSGRKLLELSMPTKASEYMISGTPVLVYAPKETAVSQLFSHNKCGYCVVRQSPEAIGEAICFLVNNEDYREEISRNAVHFAETKFDAAWIHEEWRRLLDDVSRRSLSC